MRIPVVVLALVACVHAGLWALGRDLTPAPAFDGTLASVSYTPFAQSRPFDEDHPVPAEQIRADLKVIAPYTRAIRTYSSTGGMELVPGIADEFGLKVTVGAWISETASMDETENAKNKRRNEREIRGAIDAAKAHRNVIGVMIGNETIFTELFRDQAQIEELKRAERPDGFHPDYQSVDDLIRLIKRVKREVQVPVTTGEIFSAWESHPQLVAAVDYIGAHILPYWNKVPDRDAVDQTIQRYNDLRQIYPGKRVVIAEFGWPSAGYNRGDANPGRPEQGVVLRDFASRADGLGIDYNIIEAFDQPWKTNEGSVGPYWGLFDTARQVKFSWTGPIAYADHWKIAAIAVLIGFLLSLPVLTIAGATFGQALLLAVAVHAVGAWAATLFAYWNGHYFVPGAAFALVLGVALLVPLVIVSLSRIEEIAAIAFGRKPRRLLTAPPTAPEGFVPKVVVHIPACREAPDMLKLTLDAVARLDYPNFECVLVINNTPDPAMWRPVEEHCATLGDRFKFVRADDLRGFKAGALRLALEHTAADAEIIAVIDADYVVDPGWVRDLVPAFADSTVGLVQAPQDHRDGERSVMHHAMNGEYAGFFDMGMIQRNENNAIIVHGTMCLIRRAALEQAGGWSSDTIVEDTDLGLSLLERGWRAQYTNRRYGWGLLPDTYEAFKKQRHRWAYGGTQIFRKHWRNFLPGAEALTKEQRRDFAVGWLSWLGAESIGVIVALFNLIWVPIVVYVGIAIPDRILTLPIIAVFVLSILHFAAGYRLRVPIPLGQTIGAMFAAMSMQWTVASAVGDGIIRSRLPFVRTAKGGTARRAREFQAFWEAILGGLLVAGAVVLVATNHERIREVYIFAGVLAVQSLPFLSAVAMAALEGSSANDFAFWRAIEARLASSRGAAIKVTASADKRIETVP
jgi:cellulose synthase/poly-beta-1,6-N-acetylglucosamine synthase-like glycosyltransferase/exo-beta-1,3-glucanase (GH17 family)